MLLNKIKLESIKNEDNGTLEEPEFFWTVSDMMAFENIGFSKNKEGIKYLICADCEVGPLGYHDTSERPLKYYIAIERCRPV